MPSMMAKSVNIIWIGAEMMPIFISRVLMMPSERITSCMAKVRMSRFVQNGMVIRNSQSERLCGARVAMK
jgi:hypothetical protein